MGVPSCQRSRLTGGFPNKRRELSTACGGSQPATIHLRQAATGALTETGSVSPLQYPLEGKLARMPLVPSGWFPKSAPDQLLDGSPEWPADFPECNYQVL